MQNDTHEHQGGLRSLFKHTGFLSVLVVAAACVGVVQVHAFFWPKKSAPVTPPTEGFVSAPRPTVSAESQRIEILLPSERESPQEHAARMVGGYFTAAHAGDVNYITEEMRKSKEAGMTALVFDVKGSRVYFHSTSPMATELKIVLPLIDLPQVIMKAKEYGLYTIARFIALKDPGLAMKVSASHIRHPVSGRSVGSEWVDGSKAETLEYNRQVLIEVAASGVDEINLDYIRYPTDYPQAMIGLTGAEKAERITHFLKMAREVIDAQGRGTKLGISTYAILGWNFPVNFEHLGQDIPNFADIVDIVSPMAYPSTFAAGYYYRPGQDPRSRMYFLVWRTLDGYKKLVGPQNVMKLRPWIQGYYTSAKDLQDEIDAVYDAGLCGFTVWSAGNHYDTLYDVWAQQSDRAANCIPTFDVPEKVE